MLFNNARCRALTPDYVNTASGLELHQFKWLESDDADRRAARDAGTTWSATTRRAPTRRSCTYTLGGPYFDEYRDCEYGEAWREERQAMLANASEGCARA